MKITVELEDTALDSLPPETAEALKDEERLSRFCGMACEEMLAWISGERVYQSLTDQFISWAEIYFPIIFPDSKPTADRLFNEFTIPAGRATYIARIIAEKRQSYWRKESRKELLFALTSKRKEADDYVRNKEYSELVPVTISTMAERELRSIQSRLFEKDTTLSIYKITNRGPDILTVEIPARSFLLFLEQLP